MVLCNYCSKHVVKQAGFKNYGFRMRDTTSNLRDFVSREIQDSWRLLQYCNLANSVDINNFKTYYFLV